jgi:hypothetical protein
LQIRLDRRTGKYFSFFGNYSLMDLKNNTDTPANNYDLTGEWGRASFMARHQFFMMGRFNLPKGVNFSTFINARAGSPFNILLGQDVNRDTNFNDRPAGIGRNQDLAASLYSQITQCRTIGTGGVCTQTYGAWLAATYPDGIKAIGPGSFNVNLNASKTFGLGKAKSVAAAGGNAGGMGGGGGGRGGGPGGGMGGMMGGGGPGGGRGGGGGIPEGSRYSLQVQVQVSNLLNKVNYGQYSGTLTSPYFLRSSSASAARQYELSMRFSF